MDWTYSYVTLIVIQIRCYINNVDYNIVASTQ